MSTHNVNLTDAKAFGWREIPFEPLSVSTGKYPVVRPSDFDEIIRKAEDSRNDKKVDCCIVKAPQGAGKTALSTEVGNYYKYKQDTFVILNSLLNVEPADLTKQIANAAVSNRLLDKNFLETIGFDESKKYEPSILSNFALKIFEEAMTKNRLGIWVVDEFDTISSSEEKSNDDKTDFLQFLRNIIDKLVSSERLRDKGFLLLMAHTEKSIEEFVKVLQTLHGPATERFLGTGTIEIGYNLDEVKQIIKKRLEWARINPSDIDLDPFDDRALEALYNAINEHTGSRELISFRMFEKSCYLAVKSAVKKNKKKIDAELLMQALEKIISSSPHSESSVGLAPVTKNKLRSIRTSTLNVLNNSILEGILRCIRTWEDRTLTEISSVSTEFISKINDSEIYLNQLIFNVSAVGRKGIISVRIFCLSKDKSSFNERDLDLIDSHIRKVISDAPGFNRSALAIVLDKEVLTSFENKIRSSFNMFDDILILDKRSSDDLIIVGCCADSELEQKRVFFAQHVKPFFDNLFFTSFNDLTSVPTRRCISLFQTLATCHLADSGTDQETLKTKTSQFTNGSRPTNRDFASLKELGLAKESTASYIPAIPMTLSEFERVYPTANLGELEKKMPNFSVSIDTLKQLQIFNDGSLADLSQETSRLLKDVQKAKQIIHNKPTSLTDIQLLEILVKAYNNINSDKLPKLGKLTVISFASERIPKLIAKIEKLDKLPWDLSREKIPLGEKSTPGEKKPEPTETKPTEQTFLPTGDRFDDEGVLNAANDILQSGPLTLRELSRRIHPDNTGVQRILFGMVRDGRLKITQV